MSSSGDLDTSAYRLFWHDLKQHKVLTKEEADEYARIMCNPDSTPEQQKKALDAFCLGNIRYVISIANKVIRNGGGSIDHLEDLIMEGYLILRKAAPNYDPDFGNSPTTYLSSWLKNGIAKAYEELRSPIHVPTNIHATHAKIRAYIEAQQKETGEEPTREKIAAHFERSVEEIAYLMDTLPATLNMLSLDEPVGGEDRNLAALIADDGLYYEEPVEEFAFVRKLASIVGIKNARVLELRFGLLTGKELTLEETGWQFDRVRELIRQRELDAFGKLRDNPDMLQMWLDRQ